MPLSDHETGEKGEKNKPLSRPGEKRFRIGIAADSSHQASSTLPAINSPSWMGSVGGVLDDHKAIGKSQEKEKNPDNGIR